MVSQPTTTNPVKIPENVSESVRRRNPEIYGPVRAVRSDLGERDPHTALDKKPRRIKKSKGSVALCVTLIVCRHRLLDSDNSCGSLKGLRDVIARHFGLDDADDCIRWEYGQVRTDGIQGVIVKIERLI